MKNILKIMMLGCIAVAVSCIVVGNFMFDIRASGLVFSAIMATIGMFESILSIEGLDNEPDNEDANGVNDNGKSE